jgi:hypothetical protein
MDEFETRGITAKMMFELQDEEDPETGEMERADPRTPIRALVRFLRYSNAFDPGATVQVPDKVTTRENIDPMLLPRDMDAEDPMKWTPAQGQQTPPGRMRREEMFVCEVEFEYWKGRIKMIGQPKEKWVRPWKSIRIQRSK